MPVPQSPLIARPGRIGFLTALGLMMLAPAITAQSPVTGPTVAAPVPAAATRPRPSAVISRADIAARPGTPLGDMLARTPGLRLVPIGAADWGVASARRTRTNGARLAALQTIDGPRHSACFVQVRIDGLRMTAYDGSDAFAINEIPPDRIERIEVYLDPAIAPVGISSREAACGLILVTTRR